MRCIIFFLLLVLVPGLAVADTQSWNLSNGFNFPAMNLISDNEVRSADLLNDHSEVKAVFQFNSLEQKFEFQLKIDESNLFGNSFTLQAGQSYVVDCSGSTVHVFTGITYTKSALAELNDGFNLISPSTLAVTNTRGLLDMSGRIMSVFVWDLPQQQFRFTIRLDTGVIFGEDVEINPSTGVFVRVDNSAEFGSPLQSIAIQGFPPVVEVKKTIDLSLVPVTASYENGTSSLVKAEWSSDSLSVSGNVLSAPSTPGAYTLVAYYEEFGIRCSTEVALNVFALWALSTLHFDPQQPSIRQNEFFDTASVSVSLRSSTGIVSPVVSSDIEWKLISGSGTFESNLFSPASPGFVVFETYLLEKGIAHTAEVILSVGSVPPSMKEITLEGSGYQVRAGGSFDLSLVDTRVTWSDGKVTDVVPQWSIVSGEGTLQGANYIAPVEVGVTTLEAAYIFAGDTVSTNLSLTIRSDTDSSLGVTQLIELDGKNDIELVVIPAGSFSMGSPVSETDRVDDEGPVHTVTFSSEFMIGRTEITRGQWNYVMDTTSYPLEEESLTVTDLSWNDAQGFVERLNTLTGLTFRLPTEAEWEYSARAGTTTPFFFGTSPDSQYLKSSPESLVAVHTTFPNAWGLYEVAGNAAEWCQDRYSAGWYGSSPVIDPLGPSTGTERVYRGGSVMVLADRCRSSARGHELEGVKVPGAGLRVVRVLQPAKPSCSFVLPDGPLALLPGSTIEISLIIADPDNTALTVSVGMDSDSTNDVVAIGDWTEKETPVGVVSIEWQVPKISPGGYHFYAVVSDGVNPELRVPGLAVEIISPPNVTVIESSSNLSPRYSEDFDLSIEVDSKEEEIEIQFGYEPASGGIPLFFGEPKLCSPLNGVVRFTWNVSDIAPGNYRLVFWTNSPAYGGQIHRKNIVFVPQPFLRFTDPTENVYIQPGANVDVKWIVDTGDSDIQVRLGYDSNDDPDTGHSWFETTGYTTVGSGQYSLLWDTDSLVPGVYTLFANTVDEFGQSRQFRSDFKIVVPATKPKANFINMQNETVVNRGQMLNVDYSLTGQDGVPIQLKFYWTAAVDTKELSLYTKSKWSEVGSYSESFDTGSLPVGMYRLCIATLDAAGAIGFLTESPVITVQPEVFYFDLGNTTMELVKLPELKLYMGRCEVTQGQWKAVLGYNPVENVQNVAKYIGDDLPVYAFTRTELEQFLGAINSMDSHCYRLPTHEEWLKANKAITRIPTVSQDEDLQPAWFSVDSPQPIGTSRPNAWGLYDFIGNVAEMFKDWHIVGSAYSYGGGSYSNSSDVDWESQYVTSLDTPGGGIGFRIVQYNELDFLPVNHDSFVVTVVPPTVTRPPGSVFDLNSIEHTISFPNGSSFPLAAYYSINSGSVDSGMELINGNLHFGDKAGDFYLNVYVMVDSFSQFRSYKVTCARIPGDLRIENVNGVPIEFVWIPSGTFSMGSSDSEMFAEESEKPQHIVELNKGFWMSKTEVTRKQWVAVAGLPPDNLTEDDTYPVRGRSGADWNEFATLATSALGITVQLPTEAEWEWAARAGSNTAYSWGDQMTDGSAWYVDNSSGIPHAVAGLQPNPWGLHDMSGNVAEWCRDSAAGYTSENQTNPVVLIGNNRAIRGGSWKSQSNECRSAARASGDRTLRYSDVGARLIIPME